MYHAALGTGVSDQFWPTVAAVVPVLALALVVEARTIIAHWDRDFPWIVRSMQGISWAYVLIQFAIVEIVAFNDLTGNETSSAWSGVAKVAVFTSLVTLVFGPALSIVGRANIGALARIVIRILTLNLNWRIIKVFFGSNRTIRQTRKRRKEVASQLARLEAIELQTLEREDIDSPKNQERLAEIKSLRSDILKTASDLEGREKELADAKIEIREIWRYFKSERKKLIEKVEDAFSNSNSDNKKQVDPGPGSERLTSARRARRASASRKRQQMPHYLRARSSKRRH